LASCLSRHVLKTSSSALAARALLLYRLHVASRACCAGGGACRFAANASVVGAALSTAPLVSIEVIHAICWVEGAPIWLRTLATLTGRLRLRVVFARFLPCCHRASIQGRDAFGEAVARCFFSDRPDAVGLQLGKRTSRARLARGHLSIVGFIPSRRTCRAGSLAGSHLHIQSSAACRQDHSRT